MITKRIIPCLDVKDGRVVKGVNFVNLIDAGDPVACAAAYDKAGADELVFLDITASSDARNTVVDMVKKVIPFITTIIFIKIMSSQIILRGHFYAVKFNSKKIFLYYTQKKHIDKLKIFCYNILIKRP